MLSLTCGANTFIKGKRAQKTGCIQTVPAMPERKGRPRAGQGMGSPGSLTLREERGVGCCIAASWPVLKPETLHTQLFPIWWSQEAKRGGPESRMSSPAQFRQGQPVFTDTHPGVARRKHPGPREVRV